MKKTQNIIITALFVAILCFVPVLSAALPREAVSAYENRELATFPVFSAKSLFDGSFVAGVEDYLIDHIAGREKMLEAYVRLNRDALGKPVVNDVYESDEGTLLDRIKYDHYDADAVAYRMAQQLGELTDLDALVSSYGGEFIFCGVSEQRRDRYDQYPDYLFPGTDTIDNAERLLYEGFAQAGVTAINMYDVFAQHGGQDGYYSRLDHHYTFEGARLTYETILDAVNADRAAHGEPALTVLREDDLVFHELDEPYFGSYSRKIFNLQSTQETLVWAEPREPVPFTRTDDGAPVAPTVFTPREGYASFGSYMDGDVGETVIETGRDDLPTVLIFGDSFTNPVETLLYYSFDEMRALDLRHYEEMTLFEYIELHRPDYVIALRDRMQYNQAVGNGVYRASSENVALQAAQN